ncbi:MAG: hypothetical protein KC466_00595, partial [Myxococcales bacterium]|nr:hypothetical protein [Myxococcales bacterium]
MSDSSKRGVRKLPTSASGVIAEMYPQLRDDTARYGAESARELAPELPPAPPVSRVVEDSGWGDLIDEDGDDYVNAYDNSYDIEEEDPEARVVPSLYPKGDPEFNRPIFRKPGEYPSIPVAPANRRPMDMPVMNHAPSQIYEDNPVDYDDWHHPIVRRHGLPPRHEAPGARYDVDAARGEYPDAL